MNENTRKIYSNDFLTATKLLDICRTLKERYGKLTVLIATAEDRNDLAKTLEIQRD